MRRVFLFLLIGCLALLTPRLVSAQGDVSGGDVARIHLGPVGLKPRIALTSLGVDTNVQNDATDPQNDFTMTLVPGVDSFLPIGRGLLTGKTSYELLYFKKNASQRAANLSQGAKFEYGFTRFTPYVQGDYTSTSQRPTPEIDARVHQTSKAIGAGALMKVGGRTSFDFSASRSNHGFDHQLFEGVDLAAALGHRSDAYDLGFHRALTPLTTFSFMTSLQHDRFEASSTRDSDIVSVLPSLEFKPSALISGRVAVGFTRFHPLNPDVPSFTGAIASVDVGYVMRDRTKLGGKIGRDVTYSFEPTTPYYVVTSALVSIAQNIGGRFDLNGEFSRQNMDYRNLINLAASPVAAVARRDRMVSYLAGVDYRLTPDTRVGFNVNYGRRMSPVESRRYDGYRFGGIFTYAY